MNKNDLKQIFNDSENSLPSQSTPFFSSVRVKEVILDDTNKELFDLVGGESGIGSVFISKIDNSKFNQNIFARPLFPNTKNYPLKNELIYIMYLPSPNTQVLTSEVQLYYINPINIWNHPHHNALPLNINNSDIKETNNRDYQQVELGNVKKTQTNETLNDFGETFKEKENIHPLISYEGDVIHEGRWGQSIRFGSTVTEKNNEWSNGGTDGDPIIIIRNGQSEDLNKEGWVRVNENINEDISSIYLTKNQKLPINLASEIFTSYKTPPENSKEFIGNQVIINSDRLLLNAKKDHLILSSQKSINLNSIDSVNIDTKETIIQNKVFLGDKKATESVLLGDTTIDLVVGLVKELSKLTQALSSVPPTAGPLVAPSATQLIPFLSKLQVKLKNTTKSKTVKTI